MIPAVMSARWYRHAKVCLVAKQYSIVNCFGKAGFVLSCPEGDDQIEQPPDGMSVEELHALVEMDSSLECHGILRDEDICASVY